MDYGKQNLKKGITVMAGINRFLLIAMCWIDHKFIDKFCGLTANPVFPGDFSNTHVVILVYL